MPKKFKKTNSFDVKNAKGREAYLSGLLSPYKISASKLPRTVLFDAPRRIEILREKGFNVTKQALTMKADDFNYIYEKAPTIEEVLAKESFGVPKVSRKVKRG